MLLDVNITPVALIKPASNYKHNLVVMEATSYNYVFCNFMARGGDQETGSGFIARKIMALFTGQSAILPSDCRFT